MIATESEIEEWICISLELGFDKASVDLERKPSRELRANKSKLPGYIEN